MEDMQQQQLRMLEVKTPEDQKPTATDCFVPAQSREWSKFSSVYKMIHPGIKLPSPGQTFRRFVASSYKTL